MIIATTKSRTLTENQYRDRWQDLAGMAFSGRREKFRVLDLMRAHIRQLGPVWDAGADSEGIRPSDYTNDERRAKQDFIRQQQTFSYKADLYDSIVQIREDGGDVENIYPRLELWVNRYNEAFDTGKAYAARNKPMMWTLGEAEHCSSCLRLDGKVKRANFWIERGILPRVPDASYLECRGYQ